MMHKMAQWFFGLRPFRRREGRIEITVETNETWGIQWFRQRESEHCPKCGAETVFVPADTGTEVPKADIEFLRRLIDNGRVHIKEVSDKDRLIRLNSLERVTNEDKNTKDPKMTKVKIL